MIDLIFINYFEELLITIFDYRLHQYACSGVIRISASIDARYRFAVTNGAPMPTSPLEP